jgi:nitrogen PTS system EIIA component
MHGELQIAGAGFAQRGQNPVSPGHGGGGMRNARCGMTISTLLTPELVLPELVARAKADLLEELAVHVGRIRPDLDARRLAEALHERELQSTTALENGVAIPHVRLTGLPATLAALARSPEGIDYGALDGRPTNLFLLVVVPAEQPGAHLKLLARAARLLSDARCRARLLEAPTAAALLAVVREHESQVQSLRAA